MPKTKRVVHVESNGTMRPPGANITVIAIARFTLAHPTLATSYDFLPSGDEVEVVRHDGRRQGSYVCSLEEARWLWATLRSKGYERF